MRDLSTLNKARIFLSAIYLSILALGGCEGRVAGEHKYIERGKKYYYSNNFAKARIEFKNASKLVPSDGEPYYWVGLIDEKSGDLKNAFSLFVAAVQQSPHYDAAIDKLAYYYLMGGQNDEASKRIAQVLADRPDDPEAHAIRAALKVRTGDIAGAEDEAKSVLTQYPGNISATSVLAAIYATQNNFTAMQTTLNAGIARNPGDTSLLALEASLFQQQKNYAAAKVAYLQWISTDPTDRRVRQQAAQYFLSQQHADDAESCLRSGVAAVPNDWDMKLLLVEFLDQQYGLDRAEQEIRVYLKAAPDHDDLYFWLAGLYAKHHQADRAGKLLDEIIERRGMAQPGLDARTSLAQISFTHGDADLAAQLLAVVLAQDPENPDALFTRASIAAQNGHYQEATANLRTILGDHPKTQAASRLLAEVLFRQGYLPLAVDTLDRMTEMFPDDLESRTRLAQMRYLDGETAPALSDLRDIVQAAPGYVPAWESIARITTTAKEWDAADDAIHRLEAIPGQELTAAVLRGDWLDGTGNPVQALATLSSVVRKAPASSQSQFALSDMERIYRLSGRVQDGITNITALGADTSVAHTVLGEMYESVGNEASASAEYDKAINEDAKDNKPFLARARQFLALGKPEDAEAVTRRGIAALPQDVTLPLYLAQIETNAGQYDQAITIYRALLSEDPTLDIALNNLAQLVADHRYNDPQELKAVEIQVGQFAASDNPYYLDTLGWIYYREGEFAQATPYLARATYSKLATPEMHYHYGALLEQTGRKDDAKRELQLATGDGAQYPAIDDARKILTGLQ